MTEPSNFVQQPGNGRKTRAGNEARGKSYFVKGDWQGEMSIAFRKINSSAFGVTSRMEVRPVARPSSRSNVNNDSRMFKSLFYKPPPPVWIRSSVDVNQCSMTDFHATVAPYISQGSSPMTALSHSKNSRTLENSSRNVQGFSPRPTSNTNTHQFKETNSLPHSVCRSVLIVTVKLRNA